MTLHRWKSISFYLILALLTLMPLQSVIGQAASAAQGGIFDDFQVQPDGLIEVPIEIRDVSDLYAIDIQIEFDPAVVQVEDADPALEGVQPALGTFLDAGLTLFDEVDNESGVFRFVMTQVNPSEAKSGDGVVLVLYLRGVQSGESSLDVTLLELSTRAGDAIAVEPVSGSVTVSPEAAEAAAPSIPVQDPSLLVPVPTVIPTVAPEPTTAAAEEQDTAHESNIENGAGDENTASSESNNSTGSSASPASGFSLLEHWWIVLVVVVIVIGFGIFLRATRK